MVSSREITEIAMRKTIITICLVLSGIIILDSFHVPHALAMFWLAGIIPGTNLVVDAGHTLMLFSLASGFVVSRLVIRLFWAVSARVPQKQRA